MLNRTANIDAATDFAFDFAFDFVIAYLSETDVFQRTKYLVRISRATIRYEQLIRTAARATRRSLRSTSALKLVCCGWTRKPRAKSNYVVDVSLQAIQRIQDQVGGDDLNQAAKHGAAAFKATVFG